MKNGQFGGTSGIQYVSNVAMIQRNLIKATIILNNFMDLCHQQALLAKSICAPNPAVGAVIVDAKGQVLGMGHTQKRGGPHAEIMALRDATAQGHDVRGASVYVSLEPCSHHGHTGPCCDALISAGVGRVIAASLDPNSLVSGRGFERLRAAGLEVEIGSGAEQSRELNKGFFSRMLRHMPWVRMKIAASLDGKTALRDGSSQWITSAAARADGHAWRASACAILTGIGTVLADDPRLDVRLDSTTRQPLLVVIDSRLDTPLDASLFIAGRSICIYAAIPNEDRKNALEAQGATVVYCPGTSTETKEKVDLSAMLRDLALREINEVHIEAGHKLNGSFLRDGLIDELLVYLAPKLIGIGNDMAQLGPLTNLMAATPLTFRSVDRIGQDIRILARLDARGSF